MLGLQEWANIGIIVGSMDKHVRLDKVWILAGVLAISGLNARAEIDFVKQVKPILESACLHCHWEKDDEGGLRLDTKELAMKGGDGGEAEPARVERQRAANRVTHIPVLVRVTHDPGGMSQQMVNGDPVTLGGVLRQEFLERVVDRQLAFVLQTQDGSGGDLLGQRTNSKHRGWHNGHAVFDVGKAQASLQEHLIALHDHH